MKIIILLAIVFTALFANVNDKILSQFSIISIFISIIVLLWNRRLSQEIKERERIEHELVKNQESLELALSGADLSKWEWDVKNKLYHLDDKFFELLGYNKDYLDNSINTYKMLIHPNDKEKIKKDITNHIRGITQYFQTEYRIKTKTDYLWIKITGKIVERDLQKKATKIIGVCENIDRRMKDDQEMESILEIIDKHTITAIVDIKGKIVDVSEGFCIRSGYDKSELIGKNYSMLKDIRISKDEYDFIWKNLKNGIKWEGEIKNLTKNNEEYYVYAYINPTIDEDGNVTGFVSVRDDVTAKKKVEELLIEDDLTKLYNRRFFNQVITRELNRAKRAKVYFTFVILDIDNFKKYNDNYGHIKGDITLKNVADILKKSFIRSSDFVFRLGGEEFAIIFSDTTPNDALEYANKVLKNVQNLAIEHKYNVGVGKDVVTLSAGITTLIPNDNTTEDYFYKLSDEALYIAKNSGRNKIIDSRYITK